MSFPNVLRHCDKGTFPGITSEILPEKKWSRDHFKKFSKIILKKPLDYFRNFSSFLNVLKRFVRIFSDGFLRKSSKKYSENSSTGSINFFRELPQKSQRKLLWILSQDFQGFIDLSRNIFKGLFL